MRKKSEGKLKEVVKDIATLGVGAVLETENLLRKRVEDFTSRRLETLAREISSKLVEELSKYLKGAEFEGQLRRILDEYEAEIVLKVKFNKKEGGK